MNYLNGNAIECKGKDVGDFEKQYCWLHGAGHIDDTLNPQDIKCKADQNEMTTEFKSDERHSHYYLWIPFVLVLCLAVIKAPRLIWKEVCERGMIAGAVGGTDGKPADKIAEKSEQVSPGVLPLRTTEHCLRHHLLYNSQHFIRREFLRLRIEICCVQWQWQ